MKRIFLNEVRTAYAETGLKPITDDFCRTGCGCPLAAVYEKRFGRSPKEVAHKNLDRPRPIGEVIAEELDLHPDYVDGFVEAVDGFDLPWDATARRRVGYKDGSAVRKALFEPEKPAGVVNAC